MPSYAYVIVIAAWILWAVPFFFIKRVAPTAAVDRRARWGIFLQAVGFALLWQSSFWSITPGMWRLALSVIFLVLACILSWTATQALGRQWRIDAGLNADHELVRSGPYHVVRHPIYTSMLCMLLGTGMVMTPVWLLVAALLFYIIGAEIRVRIEDGLLASRFGEEFQQYRSAVPAFLPMGWPSASPRERTR